jgi:hypothetical protein
MKKGKEIKAKAGTADIGKAIVRAGWGDRILCFGRRGKGVLDD